MKPSALYLLFVLSIAAVVAGQDNETAATPLPAYHDRGENFVAPENWGSIWPGCSGNDQSPIDITEEATHKQFAPDDLPLILEINSCQNVYDSDMDKLDTSPKWNFVDNNCFAQGQNTVPHRIAHSDIHTPAEHTLNGKRYDAEFHIGWQYMDPAGTTAIPNVLVLGFLFEGKHGAADHPLLAKLIEIQQNDNTTEDNPVSLGNNWPAMLGLRTNSTTHDVTFFNYIGSGDVPPCLGGIDWWIADTPIEVAKSQIDAIHSYIQTMDRSDDGNNVRPIQELEGRVVRTGTVPEADDTSGAFSNKVTVPLTILVSMFCVLLMMLQAEYFSRV